MLTYAVALQAGAREGPPNALEEIPGTQFTWLYWYKSTNTDLRSCVPDATLALILSLLALLVQKYKS
jgi:hypothetical protein